MINYFLIFWYKLQILKGTIILKVSQNHCTLLHRKKFTKQYLLENLLEIRATSRQDELVSLKGAIAAGERDVCERRRRVDGREQLAQVLQVVVPLQVERLVAHQPLHLHHHKHFINHKSLTTSRLIKKIDRKPSLLRPLHKIIIITTYF